MLRSTSWFQRIRRVAAMAAVVVLAVTMTMDTAGAAGGGSGPPGASGDSRATSYSGNITGCPTSESQLLAQEGPTSASSNGVTASASDPYLDIAAARALAGKSLVVFIAGGSNYNQYALAVGSQGSSLDGAHAPYDGGGTIPSISHYLVCQSASAADLPATGQLGIVGFAVVLAAAMAGGLVISARRRNGARTRVEG